ncbi:MAG: hypothetical protein AAB869_03205, partial [Patescibacteria group bacterium]
MLMVFMKRLERLTGQNQSNITRLRSVFTKRFGVGMALGLMIATILSFCYVFPQDTANSTAKAMLWGFGVTVLLLSMGGLIFFVGRLRKKKPISEGKKMAEGTIATPSDGIACAFLDALTCPLTWTLWLLMFGVVWWYSRDLLTTQNLTWVPLGLWALFVLFSKAKAYSTKKSAGKEKRAHPGLVTATKIVYRLAFLSTLAAIAYYVHFAPAGTWERETGGSGKRIVRGQSEMIIPDGIPLNPNFSSTKLANWNVTYVAANPQYQVPQARWSGKKLALLEEPGREVTEIVNLTVGFGTGNESLDIRLSGSCRAILDNRRPQISKTCAGWWKDRGGKIAGQFYLQVNEESNRYFDV